MIWFNRKDRQGSATLEFRLTAMVSKKTRTRSIPKVIRFINDNAQPKNQLSFFY